MIRSLFIWIFFGVINTLFWAIFGIFLFLFSFSGRIVHFYCAAPWSRSILWASGAKVEITGLDYIEKGKSYIFIPIHLSVFDIFSLLAYLPVDFKFILKKELMWVPFLGWAMRGAGYLSIDRSSPAKAKSTIEQAINKIKAGASILIFAEGTRSRDGRLQPLKRGGFHLAMESGSPIVPVAIKGTYQIMPKGSFRIKKGSIRIQVDRPIETTDYNKQTLPELVQRVTGRLKAMLEEKG
ncbi:MAG TPA: lysophospholipid acyltransferase family protein [Desulfatiglandales bacterium]|nr:lysophospholipid acyltransferase family protein [Desulfatiglandales bacterium]